MSAIKKRLEKMEIAFDQEEVVIVDMGSGFLKAGFSGEDLPRCVIPTSIAEHIVEVDPELKNQPGGSDAKPKTHYTFGNGAIASRHTHDYHEPIQRGVVVDMDRMEKLLDHVFTNELGVKSSNINLLLTDSPINTKDNKKALCDMVFEKFKVKSFSLMNTAILSLYSTGTTTGLVTESGQGRTYAVPVFEGYALPHAIQTLDIAGHDITQKLMKDIQAADSRVTNMDYPSIREVKEQMCHIAQDFLIEMKSRDDPLNREQRSYELPSGEIIEVSHDKRLSAAEIIFNPSLASNSELHSQPGISKLAVKAIEKCDSDLKINLYNNIVLCGGTTLMRGFKDRFESEVVQLAQDAKTDIFVSAALHRKFAAWIGASMLASFSTFADTTIKINEYYEAQQENERGLCILKKTVF